MRLKPEQVAQHVQQGLKPVYLVSGDDPLLSQEITDQLRAAARAQGFDEREVHHVDNSFDWGQFIENANALSLFAERKLHELRIDSGKPGDKGAKALLSIVEQPNPDNLYVLILPRVDKATQNAKWFKSLEKDGVFIAHWPIERHQLPGWIQNRLRQQGMRAETDALTVLAERTDGNLLAAAQEVEKLKMRGLETIRLEDVEDSTGDASRYDVFALSEAALKGDKARSLHIIDVLQGEGTHALQPLAILANEVRQLHSLMQLQDMGTPVDKAFQQLKINWPKKQSQLKAALSRHSLASLTECLQLCRQVDVVSKGLGDDDPWRLMSLLVIKLCGLNLFRAK